VLGLVYVHCINKPGKCELLEWLCLFVKVVYLFQELIVIVAELVLGLYVFSSGTDLIWCILVVLVGAT